MNNKKKREKERERERERERGKSHKTVINLSPVAAPPVDQTDGTSHRRYHTCMSNMALQTLLIFAGWHMENAYFPTESQ